MVLFSAWIIAFCLQSIWAYTLQNVRRGSQTCFSVVKSTAIESDEFKEFMEAGAGKKWKGTRDILKRRLQTPAPEYSAQDVVLKCLKALKNNDDPQLDHGSCVVLEFSSPQGTIKSSGLDPAEYGLFLRESYPALLDFKEAELIGKPIELLGAEEQVMQHVKVSGWTSGGLGSKPGETFFDFYLTKSSHNLWLIDVILAKI